MKHNYLENLQGYKNLTPQEQHIVQLTIEGHTNKEIGKKIGMHPKTVEKRLTPIYDDLGNRKKQTSCTNGESYSIVFKIRLVFQ